MAPNDTTMRFLRVSERAAGTVTWPTPATVPDVERVPMVGDVEELDQ